MAPGQPPRSGANRRSIPSAWRQLPVFTSTMSWGGAFALTGGADLNVAGFFAKGGEMRCAKIAHPALDAARELGEDDVERGIDFLEGLDPFGRDFAHGILAGVAVASGATGLHGGGAAHAAVLLVELAVDFHELTRRFGTTGEQSATDHPVGEG